MKRPTYDTLWRKRLKLYYKNRSWSIRPRRWHNNRRRMANVLFGVMQYKNRYNHLWRRSQLEDAKRWRLHGLDKLP